MRTASLAPVLALVIAACSNDDGGSVPLAGVTVGIAQGHRCRPGSGVSGAAVGYAANLARSRTPARHVGDIAASRPTAMEDAHAIDRMETPPGSVCRNRLVVTRSGQPGRWLRKDIAPPCSHPSPPGAASAPGKLSTKNYFCDSWRRETVPYPKQARAASTACTVYLVR